MDNFLPVGIPRPVLTNGLLPLSVETSPSLVRDGRCSFTHGTTCAKVAELADAPDLGSGGAIRGGSSPPFRTTTQLTAPTTGSHRMSQPNPAPGSQPTLKV